METGYAPALDAVTTQVPARSFSGEMHTLLVSRQVAGPSPVPPTFADLYRLPWREKGKSPKSALSALSPRDRGVESISLRAGKWFSPLAAGAGYSADSGGESAETRTGWVRAQDAAKVSVGK